MHKRIIGYLVIFLAFLPNAIDASGAAKAFTPAMDADGQPLCAADAANASTSVRALAAMHAGALPSTVPPSAQCAWRCAHDDPCRSFNLVGLDTLECQFYYFAPAACQPRRNCIYYKVDIARNGEIFFL